MAPMDLHCSVCSCYVQENTKHCGPCNRCCEEFDHHCKWLNNCIGFANYSIFRRLINFYLAYSLTSLFLFSQALALSLVRESQSSLTVVILLWIQAGINLVVCLAVIQLIIFHIFLANHGLTTFGYITYKQELSVKKKQVEMGELSIEELEKWKKAQLNTPQKVKSAIITKVTKFQVKTENVSPLFSQEDDTPCHDAQAASISALFKNCEESNDAKNETILPNQSIQH